jgi:hypothetical protein
MIFFFTFYAWLLRWTGFAGLTYSTFISRIRMESSRGSPERGQSPAGTKLFFTPHKTGSVAEIEMDCKGKYENWGRYIEDGGIDEDRKERQREDR